MKKKPTAILFSLKTAFFSLAVLAMIFAFGSHLATINPFKRVFALMTDISLWACLRDIASDPVLLFWMLLLVLCAMLLFLNTFCCTSLQLRNSPKVGSQSLVDRRLRGMVLIHVVALLVLVFHAVDVAFVERHKPVRLFAGERVVLGAYALEVNAVRYVTDLSYITEDESGHRLPSFKIPGDQFSIKDNMAVVTVFRGEVELLQSEFRMFAPLRVGRTFFILDGFFLPQGGTQVGILLHKVYNPIALPFFGLYALLFSLFLYQCAVTRYRSVATGRQSVAEVN